MLSEIDILEDVSQKLMKAGIPFMVTGSMAMNYYAKPRMTRDIDIVLSIKKEDCERIHSLFDKDYYISKESVLESLQNRSMFNVIHNESIIKVDFILLKGDDYHLREFERRGRVKIGEFETYIVSKEDLIISKLHWVKDSHSDMQIRDVQNIVATGYDKAYVLSWLKKLDLESLFGQIQDE